MVYPLQTSDRHHTFGIRCKILRFFQDINSSDQFIQCRKCFFGASLCLNTVQKFFYTEVITVTDQLSDSFFCLFIQTCIFDQALEEINIADAELEFFQTDRQHRFDHQGKHLCICLY